MTSTKLFNVKDNRYEYVPDEQLDGAVRSGMFKLPAGQTLRMYDTEGNAYDADNRTNFNALQDFRLETNYLRQNRERLEVAAEQPILAGVAAAARGATFGLSDVAADALGYAEKFKALKEANPTASMIGEVGGTIASAVALPGGGLVGGAAKLGQAGASVAERIIAGSVVKGAAEAGATTLAKDIAKRAAHKALTAGAGGFVEGSLYGVGQTISEAALGDPTEAAENLMSNIGFSGIINGTLMGAGGALGSIVSRKIPPGMTKAEYEATEASVRNIQGAMNQAEKEVGEAVAAKPNLASKIGELYLTALDKITPLSDDTKAILKPAFTDPAEGKALVDFMSNAPEAMQYVSEHMEKMVRSTEQAGKFLAVQGRRESIARMPTQYASNIEAGEKLAKQVIKDIDSTIRGIKEKKLDRTLVGELERVKAKFENSVFTRGAVEAEEEVFGALGEKIKRKVTKDQISPNFKDNMELMNTINSTWRDLFELKKPYSGMIDPSPKLQMAAKELENVYEKVVGASRNESVFSPAIANENKEISQIIAKQMGTYKELQQKFFTKRFIDGQATRVFDPDKFTKFIKSDESKRILQNDIFESFMVSSAATMKAAEKFNIQQALFQEAGGVIDDTITSIAEMKRLKTAMSALSALESHTGKSLQKTVLFGLLGGPVAGAVGFALDNPYQMLRYINKAQQQIIDNKSIMNRTLEKFANMPKGTAEGIAELGEPISKEGLKGLSVPKALRLGAVQAIDIDSDEPLTLEEMLANPTEATVERMMYRHGKMNEVLPNVSGQLGAQAFNAIEFLKSKMPKDPNTKFQVLPAQVEFTIPPSERAKFERYVEVVNDPTVALKKMNDGTLTGEHVEALQVVYPRMYAEAQRTVMEMLGEKKLLTFKQKVQLGLFMQAPTMPAYDPTIFASIQTQYALVDQEEQVKKVPQTLGQNLKTSFDRAATR